MSHDQPSILVMDDSPHSRRYLSLPFSRASWSVQELDPMGKTLDFLERLPCEGLTAAIADWHLAESPFSGLEALSAVRKGNGLVACVLYTIWARGEEWISVREDARKTGILALEPRNVNPEVIFKKVLEEVKRLRPGFQEPRQTWEDYEAWIRPEDHAPGSRLEQAIELVGKGNLVPILQGLFPDRGPQRPIHYDYLKSGFSGSRVFLLNDPSASNPGPRYIAKVAQGDNGHLTLSKEHTLFHRSILGDNPNLQKLVGYVAEELRPPMDQGGPVRGNDWFGIAYREVGNGTGQVTSFRELYLGDPETGPEEKRYRQLKLFLDRLYSSCLGNWFQCKATASRRKLWAASLPPTGSKAEACYYLDQKKKLEIFIALAELRPRASILLDRLCGARAVKTFIHEVKEFVELGWCNSGLAEAVLFHREFMVLEASTHGDLHAGNVLSLDRKGEMYPFLIDFSEFEEKGHPFYDYARLENDIRLRLMGYEDGSDILDELLAEWLNREERLKMVIEERHDNELPASPGSVGFIDKAYKLIAEIRGLAYQNLSIGLKDQSIRPSKESFSAQYTSALLHRTLISLASTDIVPQKKILGLWLAHSLISRLGTLVGKMTS